MRKFLSLLLFAFTLKVALGQVEQVTSMKVNPKLFYPALKHQQQNNNLKYLVANGNTVVAVGAPLSLPFIDDFSSNRTPYYTALTDSIYDSLFNVSAGPNGCLGVDGVNTLTTWVSLNPTYTYYWDTAYQEIDSVEATPLVISFVYPSTFNCITDTVQFTQLFWPIPFEYTFDSIDGYPADSFPASIPGVDSYPLTYAPVIYFSVGETGTLWFDDYAYINNTFPINPPTIGVATMDGLNQYGLPYNSTTNTGGQADYLTSNQINLGSINAGDSSIYLSFFYEGGGYGDYPGVGDSLILEFLDNYGVWQMMWNDTGYVDTVPDTFQQVLINVPQLDASGATFFYSTFQFRFRNVVSLYGSNNLWNIDYVRLDKNRNAGDTLVNDMAFQYNYPTVLKNYTLEPGPQINFPGDLADTVSFPIRNLQAGADTNPPATPYYDTTYQLYPVQALVAAPPSQTFNARPYDTLQIFPSTQFANLPTAAVDSLVLNSEIQFNHSDDILQNNSIQTQQIFSNVMAYDDGTAEKAYGLIGGSDDVKKFAYEFILNRPDTLVGYQVLFTQVEYNVSDLVFNFEIWDSIQLNSFIWMDTPVYTAVNQIPYDIDSTNGFTTYLLDTPMIVSNKVYIGWAQTDTRRLQVGLDMNSPLGWPHMFTYIEGKWDSTSITFPCSPMMRLIFGHSNWGNSVPSVVKDLTKSGDNLQVFPNPTSGLVQINYSRAGALFAVDVENNVGQRVVSLSSVSNQFNLASVANGIYLVNLRDLQTGQVFHKKLVKTSQ